MIGHDWSGLVTIGHDWSGLVMIGHDWSWLVTIGHDWSGLVRIGQDWSWLVTIGHDWSWSWWQGTPLQRSGTQEQDNSRIRKIKKRTIEPAVKVWLKINCCITRKAIKVLGFFVTFCVVRGEVQYAGFAVIGRGENIHSRPALPNTHNWVFPTMKKLLFEHNKCLQTMKLVFYSEKSFSSFSLSCDIPSKCW